MKGQKKYKGGNTDLPIATPLPSIIQSPSVHRAAAPAQPLSKDVDNASTNTQSLLKMLASSRHLGQDLSLILAFFAPTILSVSILIFAIFSGTIGKGLFYLFWVMMGTLVRIAILWINNISPITSFQNDMCNLSVMIPYDNASYSIYILAFSAMYFILPMFMENNVNYMVFMFFGMYLMYDIFVKVKHSCVTSTGIAGDLIGGLGLGAFVSSIIYTSPIKNLLFINEMTTSSGSTCSKPSKQQFKCAVYKNGELVGSRSS